MQIFVIINEGDKCRCEYKELIEKGMCDKGFIWNPSNCDCECYKSCDVGKYLNYNNCKCRNKLVDKLGEECIENIDGNEMIDNETLNENVCNSCTIYIVSFIIFLIISLSIGNAFIYFHWYLKRCILKQQFIKHINGIYCIICIDQYHYF